MYPSCPRCGGVLYKDYDGYEDYLTCFGCAREFDFNMIPLRMTKLELNSRYVIKLKKRVERASMRME